ncbi:g protein-coupled receptor [Anaeramoeba flamelloides]|nr:g protein-coupled receptor [Anaeramoeba flamelloides]
MVFDTAQQKVTVVFVVLCLFGYLQIIIVYLKLGLLKKLNHKLTFTLAIYDSLSSITFFLPGSSSKALCKLQTYISSFLTVLPPFWCASIALLTFLVIVKRTVSRKMEQLYRFLHIFSLIGATVWMIVTILYSKPKPIKDYWCLIQGNMLLAQYIWYWVAIALCLIFSIISINRISQIIKIHEMNSRDNKKETISVQYKMVSIPLVFVWCYIWPTINRVYEIKNLEPPRWIQWMHVINFSLTGIIFCLIFIWLTPQIRERVLHWILCKEKTKWKQMDTINKKKRSPLDESNDKEQHLLYNSSSIDSSLSDEEHEKQSNSSSHSLEN